MHHFDESSFLALSPAKAKAHALAMFEGAQLAPDAADWRGVAYALHAVMSRARGKARPDTVTDDDMDGFTPWHDAEAAGKASTMARGRVTVTFADGWACTVGMLAGKRGKSREPWSIGPAVRFAVLRYKLALARRVTGSDAVMYHDLAGDLAGFSVPLDALLSCPDVVHVETADGLETVAGDARWNPDHANAATYDMRQGRVTVAGVIGPHGPDVRAEIAAARLAMLETMGHDADAPRRHAVKMAMKAANEAAAARVAALVERDRSGYRYPLAWELVALFGPIINSDPDAYPWDADAVAYMGKVNAAPLDADAMPEAPDAAPTGEPQETPDAPDAPDAALEPEHAPCPVPPACVDLEPAPMVNETPLVSADDWTVWTPDGRACMSTVYPAHVVVIEGSHSARIGRKAVSRVIGLRYPQSGGVVEIADAVGGIGKGCRVTGPRHMTKFYRAEAARFQNCQKAADVLVGFDHGPHDPFTHWAPDALTPYSRRPLLADALYAFGWDLDGTVATGELKRGATFWAARGVESLLYPADGPCEHGRTIRHDDLNHAFGAVEEAPPPALAIVASNPAPLMIAGPPALLCLPKPSPANRPAKPRYRLTAAGTFERIAA